MNILLIGINFGNYEKKIRDEMVKQGHSVYYMFDAHPRQNAIHRLLGDTVTNKCNDLYRKRMIRNHDTKLDLVVIIVGREVSQGFLKSLKQKNPSVKFILYLWDDVKRVKNFNENRSLYDRIYSFDPVDCEKYGFIHLPLFFTERPTGEAKKEIDVYSAMFSHSERERIVSDISVQVEEQGKRALFYISLGLFAYSKRKREIRKTPQKQIRYIASPIPESENYQNMEKALAILDIQFVGQNGLTMRTIESLGMMNKLITTNQNVKKYDFYDEHNIAIIDRENPILNPVFLDTPYYQIDPQIYEKYSLKTWVKTITETIEVRSYFR